MGESGERGWILVIDVSSDRPMGSDHTLNQNFSHKEFFKKYSYLVILNRLEETNISICFSINRFFKASSLLGPEIRDRKVLLLIPPSIGRVLELSSRFHSV